MKLADLIDLADRCEAATGAEYALDCEIWDVIYPGERQARFDKLCSEAPYRGRLGPADKNGYVQPLRAFTASIDAALTLVPEGWTWTLLSADANEGDPDGPLDATATVVTPQDAYHGYAATPELALCAAALRARAAIIIQADRCGIDRRKGETM